MSFYEVKVVQRASPHAVIATFDADVGDGDVRMKATVDEVTWALNEPGLIRFRVPVFHPAAASILVLRTEVQVWRNGVIVHWGVPVQRELDGASLVFYCPGLAWYWSKLYFGPVSTNYLLNPDFTTNLTSWTTTGATSSHSTAIRLLGPGTAKLVAAASGDNYLQQTFSVTTGVIGLFLAVKAWYWLDPADPITEPALEERGLYVSAPGSLPDGSPSWEPINMNAPVGTPQRVETGIHLPVSSTVTVTVRLYAPKGTIHWGATSVTALESVSSEPEGTDVTEMMRRVVDYAENGTGKFSHNITTSTPAAGVKETLAYQFADLAPIYPTLLTYPQRGLADFKVVVTSTTRVFTTYAPRKGSLKSGSALTVPGAEVLRLGHRLDGQQTVTKVIRRGAGDGSDREFGLATDTSAVDGLVLEDVSDAPLEVSIDGLNDYATTDLARLSDVVALPDVEVAAEGWIGVVEEGDTVPVTIDWGAIQETVNRRVVSMTLLPVSDTVRVAFAVTP